MLAGTLLVCALSYFFLQRLDGSGTVIFLPQAVLFIAVIYLVATGADWLVNSACRIAETLGISQLVIGLTVVAFGTSAPEGAVSLIAGFRGNGDITIANVVGSNIFNLCFILGGMALIVRTGLPVTRELVVRDAPLLLATTLLLFLFVGGISTAPVVPERGFGFSGLRVLDLELGWIEGAILFGILMLYLCHLYRVRRRGASRTEGTGEEDGAQGGSTNLPLDAGLFFLGTAMVVGGCHVLVGYANVVGGQVDGLGAVWFAKRLNISDYVVGVTIVAAGTSAPEFAVSLVAAVKGRYEVTIGNLVGSDLFNMLGVLGLAGMVLQQPLAAPVSVTPAAIGSLLALSALVAVTWMFMWRRGAISWLEGSILVSIGVARWVMDFISQGV